MFLAGRVAKPVLGLLVVVAVTMSGCGFVKPGSLTVSQPQGIGAVRVHFVVCTLGEGGEGLSCGAATNTETVQYLAGIAVPPGSVPPASFTAVPSKGGPPIVFTRNEEVVPEMTAASAAEQKLISEAKTPKEKEEAQAVTKILGGPWPPSGLQGVGYLSSPTPEVEGETLEWSVDADFGLPSSATGGPFAGPFSTGIAFGLREVDAKQPASRPVRCVRIESGSEGKEGEALCTGSLQEAQPGTADLRISGPSKPAQAFVGGNAQVSFPLRFGGTTATVPTFSLSATTTVKGGKAKVASTFTPKAPNSSTHLSPPGTGKVTVSLPRRTKPGTYEVVLTAATPQGGTTTGTARVKVAKPKLKFGSVRASAATGTATLQVKVPGSGRLTVSGKGIVTVKKRAKKAKSIAVKILPTGRTSALLGKSGSARIRVKATFKPSSGISVSKTKSVVLRLG